MGGNLSRNIREVTYVWVGSVQSNGALMSQSSPREARSPLIGRDEEIGVLNQAFEDADKGRAQPVFIEGEAGIGKTRLVEEALQEAGRRGFQVWTGEADELEQDRPFGPLLEALDLRATSDEPSRAEIGQLLAASGAETALVPPSHRERLIEDIVTVVEEAASEQPAALVIEDLHWADPSTLLTLRRLVRRAALARLAVIASFRSSPAPQKLVQKTPGALHLVLEPLDDEASSLLVAALLDATPGPRLLAETAKAGGNPLFLTELIAALHAADAISRDNGTAEYKGGGLPDSLRLLILRRLSHLPEETLDILRLSSVLGGSFSIADLSVVTGRRASELAPLVREATVAGLFRVTGEELTWRHDMVRDAIYGDVPRSLRTALHLQSARALASAGGDALGVAAHFSLGASPGDAEAVSWLRKAAREAAPRDAAVRAELLARALHLVPEDSREHQELEVEQAGAFLWSGRIAEAERLARTVLERTDEAELKESARSVVSLALFFQNRMGEAGAEFEAASRDRDTPETSRLGLLAQAAMGYLQGGEAGKALDLAWGVISKGEETDNHFATAVGYAVLGWMKYFGSHVAESIDLQRRAVAAADIDPTGEAHRRHPFLIPGLMLLEGDLLDEATESFRSGLELGERMGIVWHVPLYHGGLGWAHLYRGAWDGMRAEFETAWDIATETGSMWGSVAFRSLAAWAAVHQDDLNDAERLLTEAQMALEKQGMTMDQVWAFWANAALLDARGSPKEAMAELSKGWDLFSGLGLLVVFRLLGPDLARLAVAAGDKARAETVADQVEEHARRAEVPSARGAALQCQGLAADDPDVLLQAVAAYRESPRVVHTALATEDAGICLAGHDRSEEAVEHLKEALEIYERTGMRRDAGRTEGRLRSMGVRRGAKGRRGRPQQGWESLTGTEVRVASFAASGMTNPEIAERLFISRRTVETHMSHVLAKVGLSSRVELAAEAARRTAT